MEAMMIGQEFIDSGYPIGKVLGYLNMAKSSFYYQAKGEVKKRGVPKSTHTRKKGGAWVSNEEVIKDIHELFGKEFVDYGYIKTTHWLQRVKEYIINKKKVYRLMKEQGLLNRPVKLTQKGSKTWIKDFVPKPSKSLEYFEMDIKYIYIHGKKRSALLLSVIDVESRWIIGQKLAWKMKQEDVICLFDEIFAAYQLPGKIYIRNDNGSQFEAEMVQEYFKNLQVNQEFTKPATPEQNAHIESYHSILEKIICKGYQFESLQDALETMKRWIQFYNRERIHSGIGYQAPIEYLRLKGIDIDKLMSKEILAA